ncbi:hypothetical protein PtB15_9B35 [Puccinia triticina]|nr:hypothetical protein PtB15_9B35 [Puccinia triticina]
MSDIDDLTSNVLGLGPTINAPAESLAAGTKPKNPAAKKQGRTVKLRLSVAAEKANPNAGTEEKSDDKEEDDDPQVLECLRSIDKQGDGLSTNAEARAKLMKEALEAQVAGDSVKADQILAKIQLKLAAGPAIQTANVSTAAKRTRKKQEPGDRVKENGSVFYKAEVNSFLGLGLPPFFDKNMKELKDEFISLIQPRNQPLATHLHSNKIFTSSRSRLKTTWDPPGLAAQASGNNNNHQDNGVEVKADTEDTPLTQTPLAPSTDTYSQTRPAADRLF